MELCPNCQTENAPGTEFCTVCGTELRDDKEPTDLVELARLANVSEAEMIDELLEKNGISTVVRGQVDPIGIASRAEVTTLLVEKRDLPRALELYKAYFAGEGTTDGGSATS